MGLVTNLRGPQGPPGSPGSSGSLGIYDLDAPGTGIKGDGTTDDSAAIQAFINGVPDGSEIVYGHKYLCKSGLNLSHHTGLLFRGKGGAPYTLGDVGPQFISGTAGMTLFTIDNSSGLVSAGPQFWNTGFFDAAGAATMFKIGNTNRWGFGNCNFYGTKTGTRTACGISLFNSTSDLAYWWIWESSFLNFGPVGSYTSGNGALVVTAPTQQGGQIYGGAWQGNWPSMDLRAVGPRVFGCKFDSGNPAVRDACTSLLMTCCHFEIAAVPGSGYEAINPGASAPTLTSCDFSTGNNPNTGTTGWIVDAGVFGAQVIAPSYSQLATNYVDSGTDTMILRGVSSDALPFLQARGLQMMAGTSSPAGRVAAPVGSVYFNKSGGAGTTLFVKESGVSTSGWVGK